MKPEDKVCAVVFSKRLKELGVKQDSLFYFCERLTGHHNETEIKLLLNKETTIDEISKYSAFIAEELCEMFPPVIAKDQPGAIKVGIEYYNLHECLGGKYYCISDVINYPDEFECRSYNFADCLAEQIIYLIENGYIKL